MDGGLRSALCAATLCLIVVGAGSLGKPAADARKAGGQAQDGGHGYFPASFFTHRLPDDAVIDRASPELVSELRNLAMGLDPQIADCNPSPISAKARSHAARRGECVRVTTRAGIVADEGPALYVVTRDQARVPVTMGSANPSLRRVMAAGVPIPAGAEPALGSDRQLIIWQPGTDTMWEFWRARHAVDGWHAGFGGRIRGVSESPGHFQDVPDPTRPDSYREQHSWGGPASSIPNLPGMITLDDLRSGKISHALVFATWANNPGKWVYPAQRTDGKCRGPYCSRIPQGARFRLGPNYKIAQLEHPLVRMIARAVKNYGMVLNNSTGGGLAFYAEGWSQHGIEDPYNGPNGFFSADPSQLQPTQFMSEFPWDRLRMLRRGTTCRDSAVECPAPRWWPARRSR